MSRNDRPPRRVATGSNSLPARPAYLTIGTITSPRGVRGEVNVFAHTDSPERFAVLREVWCGAGGQPRTRCAVEACATGGRMIALKLAGVDSREQAESLRGTDLLIPIEQAWPLPAGSYYHFELEGLQVYDTKGVLRGTLNRVYPGPANDFYGVTEPASGRETLLAAVRSVIKQVDPQGGRMVVEWPEEYPDAD